MSGSHLIIIGASARAAATSALRAGWTPWCSDLFADADLERIATVRKVPLDSYPHGLLDALVDAPDAPVIYTGGLENHPDLVARIDRPLWGNVPDVLRAIRSPERWTKLLRAHNVCCPDVSDVPQADGEWLVKPRKSAGGLAIHKYARRPFNPRSHFLQARIDGVPCSAIYLGRGNQSALWLGASQQLVGVPWLNAHGFQYCGNIGPLPLDDAAAARWQHLGDVLTQGFGLRGLFGVDAIVKDGVPWPVEINPRYTASLELFERSYRQALLPLHRAVFEEAPLPTFTMPATPTIWGKAILYARQTSAFPAGGPWLDADCADIPHVGEVIERDQPVLTLFASSATVSGCETMLQEKTKALDRRFCGDDRTIAWQALG